MDSQRTPQSSAKFQTKPKPSTPTKQHKSYWNIILCFYICDSSLPNRAALREPLKPWGGTGTPSDPGAARASCFSSGSKLRGGTNPGAEQAHAAQGRQLTIPLQRKVMFPSSTTHPSPFGEHVCSPAMSFLFKQLVSVGSRGKKILLL